MSSRINLVKLALASSAGLGLVAALAPASALAVAARPLSASGCVSGQDSCISVNGSGQYVNWIEGWAPTPSFAGHIQITDQHGLNSNSANSNPINPYKIYPARNFASGDRICSTVWKVNGSGYVNEGTACETVG